MNGTPTVAPGVGRCQHARGLSLSCYHDGISSRRVAKAYVLARKTAVALLVDRAVFKSWKTYLPLAPRGEQGRRGDAEVADDQEESAAVHEAARRARKELFAPTKRSLVWPEGGDVEAEDEGRIIARRCTAGPGRVATHSPWCGRMRAQQEW